MINYKNEFIIQGITHHGRTFRPSDWAERLCGAVTCFLSEEQSVSQKETRFSYSPYVNAVLFNGIHCLRVNEDLCELNSQAFRFLINFAKDNDLQIVHACLLADDKEGEIMIKVGDRLPLGELTEFIETETTGCSVGPKTFQVADLTKNKKIVLFAVPGAFTPTCSEKHLPGFIKKVAAFKAQGVDEIWVISVNDAFVMHAWGNKHGVNGAIRLFADGNATFVKALGLDVDFSHYGMGIRAQRFSALVDNGVVKQLNVETGGEFRLSSAEVLLEQLG